MPNGNELVLETLLKFCHFESAPDSNFRDNLGAPPLDGISTGGGGETINGEEDDDNNNNGRHSDASRMSSERRRSSTGTATPTQAVPSENGMKKKAHKSLTYSQIRWIGEWYMLIFLLLTITLPPCLLTLI